MRNILEKLGAFFETHVEKLVLGLALLICGWVLMTRVVFSPNRVEYQGQTFSPTAVDNHIAETYAGEVEARLAAPADREGGVAITRLKDPVREDDPVRVGVYGNLDGGFLGLVASSISDIDTGLMIPMPSPRSPEAEATVKDAGKPRDYRLPLIGDVWDVAVEHIRAAAYVPIGPLTEDDTYDQANSEPNDIDLITVQGTFNVATLYRRFTDNFTGDQLPEDWRDEELAKPIFGAVHLQRQQRLADGSWGEWRDVPRIATEHRRQLFAPIENVEDLPPGGVQVRRLQLGRDDVQSDLLQPAGYSMASAYEQWYPPALHREYTDAYAKMKKTEKREEREADQDRRGASGRRGRTGETTSRSRDTRGGAGGGGGAYGGGEYGGGGAENTRRRSSPRGRTRGGAGGADASGYGGEYGSPTARGRGAARGRPGAGGDPMMDEMYGGYGMGMGQDTQGPLGEVEQKFYEVLLTPGKELEEETDLLFWAHDDTVEPGMNYRYRMRLGVLNPVANTNYLAEEFAEFRKKALLWSEFSAVSEEVSVPRRTYFFATSFREDVNTMKVEVAKYLRGYWRVESFDVKPGATIGRVVDNRADEEKRNVPGMGMPGMEAYGGYAGYGMTTGNTATTVEPEEIDYRTQAVFLGTSKVEAWIPAGAKLREQVLYRMLYSEDGIQIARVPVSSANWNPVMREAHAMIQREKRRDREDFKSFEDPVQNRGGMDSMMGYGPEMMGYGN